MNNQIKKVTKRNVWHILSTYHNRPIPLVVEAMIFAIELLKEKRK